MAHRIFTSESVTEGHPDKVCDQISDAVLDAILAQDPYGRVACETVTTTGLVMVMGEISTSCYVDIPGIVRRTVDKIGYNDPAYGFDAKSCAVMTTIDEQSKDIAMGVDGDSDEDIGAGDQGMMFGVVTEQQCQRSRLHRRKLETGAEDSGGCSRPDSSGSGYGGSRCHSNRNTDSLKSD